ncbi:TlpA family protein disulfide reductase [Alteromonas lipolytica]|uniref:Thioredoxin domain-containing protein n=1 Tax=Alteromonas lipolytica TaxID=1856405 RepID=A0A1E8F8D3_9ALTE|nr:TlpA disulfide reductase family protein [Alteromonas lipolytica]OFI32179.1 hypothetical protein BFC17_08105 [Alteromonas lipolytica]GGF83263.1 protein disulfide oxidoreductase [Alteromonas lipolytica]
MRYINLISIVFVLLLSGVSSIASAQEQQRTSPQAPEFEFVSLRGETFTFPASQNAKPTLLYFWATWCPYCKKVTPKVVNLHKQYGDVIDVLAVNVGINDSVANANRYINDYAMTFPVAYDHDNHISQAYGVLGTPVFVIVSQSGQLLYRGHRYPEGIEQVLSQ